MLSRIISAIVVMVLAACAVIPAQQTYNSAVDSSLLVEDEAGSGSAVVINDRCALTAKHVVSQVKGQKLTSRSGREYTVVSVVAAEYSDLSVVCVGEPFAERPVHIRQQMPPAYSPLFVVGNPLGHRNIVTTGVYQGDDGMSAPIAWGNSGGGVFDESGSLIGIAVAVTIKRIEQYVFVFPHLGFMETSRNIIPFLDEHHIRYHSAE